MTLTILLVGAYVLGAIPFGYLVAKTKGIDIRAVGSGNIGATNVLRTLGKGPGIAVLVLDILKGLIPSMAAKQLMQSSDLAFLVGIMAVFGHSFSPFLGFKGGKGIATGLGAMLGSVTLVGLGAFTVFFVFMGLTMIVSLSSLMAAVSLPVLAFTFGESVISTVALSVMGLYIILRHRPNIARIIAKTEPRLGQKTADEPRPKVTSQIICILAAIALGAIAFIVHRNSLADEKPAPTHHA